MRRFQLPWRLISRRKAVPLWRQAKGYRRRINGFGRIPVVGSLGHTSPNHEGSEDTPKEGEGQTDTKAGLGTAGESVM